MPIPRSQEGLNVLRNSLNKEPISAIAMDS